MEKLFGFFYRNQIERNKFKKGFVDFNLYQNQIKTFANLVSPTLDSIEIGASLWGCGFINDELLVPEQLVWTESELLNMDLLKLLVLKAIATKELNIQIPFHDKSRNYPRIMMLSYMPQINRWLDNQFPFFANFENQVYQKYFKYVNNKNQKVFSLWLDKILSREMTDILSKKDIKTVYKLNEQLNDIPFDFLFATVPLPYREIKGYGMVNTDADLDKKTQKSKTRSRKEHVVNADQKKKESVNPVTHSFEKMETLDDYEGGARISSSEDELQDHETALQEVELNSYTNQGKASGVYRQDMQIIKNTVSIEAALAVSSASFHYDEWDYRKNQYSHRHCSLREINPVKKESEKLVQELQKLYSKEITTMRSFFQDLLNEPLWKKRQIEGSELDIDNIVRILSSDYKCLSSAPAIYQKKTKQNLDIEISFLIDVSYSTDTWLDGKRVIDIIRDSIFVFGESIKDQDLKFSVSLAFSETRKKISYLNIKSSEQNWFELLKYLHEFQPRQYTRLGPAIRHNIKKLIEKNSKVPIMVVISDCKPTDLDPYEGKYGEQDVKQAILEAHRKGIGTLLVGVTDLQGNSLDRLSSEAFKAVNPEQFCLNIGHFLTQYR